MLHRLIPLQGNQHLIPHPQGKCSRSHRLSPNQANPKLSPHQASQFANQGPPKRLRQAEATQDEFLAEVMGLIDANNIDPYQQLTQSPTYIAFAQACTARGARDRLEQAAQTMVVNMLVREMQFDESPP